MIGIILAGGTGSRLNPLTQLLNKHMLPVYNKNMIMYPLQTLMDANIKEIMIVSGREHAGQFLQMLGSGKDYNINLTYTVQEESGGIAQALGMCKRFAKNDNIAVILGDNLYEDKFDFSDFREGCRLYLKKVSDPERFGVARIINNELIEIVEKPKNLKYDDVYAVTGLYLYSSDVFNKISCLTPSHRGELEITDINNLYIKEKKIEYEIVDGFWSDMGTFESLYKASEFIRNK
jgi:glucose-1-phosphate thymidylyltransferase